MQKYSEVQTMTNPLNEKDYVTFARRFVKETVETMDYKELQSLVTDYIHEDLQKSYDDIGQISVFETMSAWNSDVFDEIAEDYPFVLEDTEGWTDEDFGEFNEVVEDVEEELFADTQLTLSGVLV